jgi:hypothetical protein
MQPNLIASSAIIFASLGLSAPSPLRDLQAISQRKTLVAGRSTCASAVPADS